MFPHFIHQENLQYLFVLIYTFLFFSFLFFSMPFGEKKKKSKSTVAGVTQ